MTETPEEKYYRIERQLAELIEKVSKEDLGQVARMLAQSLIHHRVYTGLSIPMEQTMIAFNSPKEGPFTADEVHSMSAEALAEIASLLAWQSAAGVPSPPPLTTLH